MVSCTSKYIYKTTQTTLFIRVFFVFSSGAVGASYRSINEQQHHESSQYGFRPTILKKSIEETLLKSRSYLYEVRTLVV